MNLLGNVQRWKSLHSATFWKKNEKKMQAQKRRVTAPNCQELPENTTNISPK